jgi:hypothetical protein
MTRGRTGVLALAFLVASVPRSHAELCYTAVINGAQAGTPSTGTGFGLFLLNDAETALTYKVTYSGLIGIETASHIHNEAEADAKVKDTGIGPVKIGVWTTTNTVPLNAARVAALKAGQLYHNIHSIPYPAGEIRGQILPAACAVQCFDAVLDGSASGSPATGLATFVLNHTETDLTYEVEFSGLAGVETGAHIHNDGEGGAVVLTMGAGSPKAGTWHWSDPVPLSALRVNHLKAGLFLVDVHSTLHAGGEIAGHAGPGDCAPTAAGDPPARSTLLLPNFPNPFNPGTTIAFTLRAPGRVRLAVFDVDGVLVASLIDGPRDAGYGEAHWNGTDTSGRTVRSGIYFCRLSAGGVTETRKLVLLK